MLTPLEEQENVCVMWCRFRKEKREGRTKLDDLSEEDYTSMSRVKHLAMIPIRRIARMEDDGDNACDALVRKLGLNSRCEASLAKLAKYVVNPNLTHLREIEEVVSHSKKIMDSEKQEEAAYTNKENNGEVVEEKEPENGEENRKALASLESEEQTVALDKDLAEMRLLSSKKCEEDIFAKLISSDTLETELLLLIHSFMVGAILSRRRMLQQRVT
ncbi:hypothetical protein Tco_1474039 [Tanacetum coccineum]